MDIHLAGDGLSFKIEMESADANTRKDSKNYHFFKINKVDVQVKNFSINVKQSKHKLLLTLAKPLMMRVIRPALQKVAEQQIRQNASQLDEFLYGIQQEAQRAQEDFKQNPTEEQAQGMYQRYANALNKQIMQGKQKKHEMVDNKTVNMAVTNKDSIFPNVKMPGGISSKATEYKDLAAKGEKWESPVFSLGSAKETSNVPQPANIKRKHQGSATGQAMGAMTNGPTTGGGNTGAGAGLGSQMDKAFEGQRTTNGNPGAAIAH